MIETLWQALRFGLVGLANTAVGLLSIYATIYFFGFSPLTANAVGYGVGLVLSFALNRVWTFQDSRSVEKVLPRYLLVAAVSYLLNFIVVLIGTYLMKIGPYLVQLLGIVTYTLAMFSGCKWLVFSIGANQERPKISAKIQ